MFNKKRDKYSRIGNQHQLTLGLNPVLCFPNPNLEAMLGKIRVLFTQIVTTTPP